MNTLNNKARRLFIALWPEPEVRHQIGACQQNLDLQSAPERCAQLVKPENLHLTLRFIGTVAESRIDALCARLARITQPGFELSVQDLGFFAAPRILWLGLKTESPELLLLVAQIERAVDEVLPELKGGGNHFIAHISLCKNVRSLATCQFDDVITWQVKHFSLIESLRHKRELEYRVLQQWPLSESD